MARLYVIESRGSRFGWSLLNPEDDVFLDHAIAEGELRARASEGEVVRLRTYARLPDGRRRRTP